MTVGSGVAPDLLTLSPKIEERRSRAWATFARLQDAALSCPYRRWGLSPRPENGQAL